MSMFTVATCWKTRSGGWIEGHCVAWLYTGGPSQRVIMRGEGCPFLLLTHLFSVFTAHID